MFDIFCFAHIAAMYVASYIEDVTIGYTISKYIYISDTKWEI